MHTQELRHMVITSLEQQGFRVEGSRIHPPSDPSKEKLHQLHELAVKTRLEKARKGLQKYESELINRFASGKELDPAKISPRLVEVKRGSKDELLFRYACLHWSIPVSSGYGRGLRFIVIDENNDKLIGLLGLGDPVFSLAPRDHWVGWDKEGRRARLHHVLDAFDPGGSSSPLRPRKHLNIRSQPPIFQLPVRAVIKEMQKPHLNIGTRSHGSRLQSA